MLFTVFVDVMNKILYSLINTLIVIINIQGVKYQTDLLSCNNEFIQMFFFFFLEFLKTKFANIFIFKLFITFRDNALLW